MKHTLTLYYSVQNGGDGSAYPQFMESAELAEYDQENMDEGWGESCTGSIELESDSPITVKGKEVTTKESYLINMLNYTDFGGKHARFITQFFPNGLPIFRVEEKKSCKKYSYNHVFVGNVEVAKVFKDKKESGAKFEEFLNSLQSKSDNDGSDDDEDEEDDW